MNNVYSQSARRANKKIIRKAVMLGACFLALMLAGCAPAPSAEPGLTPPVLPTLPAQTPSATATIHNPPTITIPTRTLPPAENGPIAIWVSPETPLAMEEQLGWGAQAARSASREGADAELAALKAGEATTGSALEWVYVLAAPFPTLLDDVRLADLQAAWRGSPPEELQGFAIYTDERTRLAFESAWGPAGRGAVQTAPADELLELTWSEMPALTLLPFEALEPRWKVIRVDGMAPLDGALDVDAYPLALRFGLRAAGGSGADDRLDGTAATFLPASNYEPGRMTVVIMTGVTALARSTALRMEEEGVLYPAQDIGELLRSADFTHISNEVPFFDRCPPARPLRAGMRFCSDASYIELLRAVGANIIELTGNHLLDWGVEAMTFTLELYRENEMAYFGGGSDLDEARRPLLMEHNGNRLAFIGCNSIGPEAVFATPSTPGAAPCDLDWMEAQVSSLRSRGYLPVVTFQSIELDDPLPHSMQRADFNRMAAAGAVIVSGSQAHIPQAMAFNGDAFIHYGLGNLFFDQMEPWQRPQFIDRHIFYDGRYLQTELVTTMLEDASRPRLMTEEERQRLLIRIFEASGW